MKLKKFTIFLFSQLLFLDPQPPAPVTSEVWSLFFVSPRRVGLGGRGKDPTGERGVGSGEPTTGETRENTG